MVLCAFFTLRIILTFYIGGIMNTKNTDIFGRKVFFIAPDAMLIPLSFMEDFCTLGYESHIVSRSNSIPDSVRKITKNFPDALIFFNIDTSIPGISYLQFIRQIRQENADIAIGIIFSAINQEQAKHIEADYKNDVTPSVGCIALFSGKNKENFDSILSALEKSGAKGRRNNIRAKCNNESHISFWQGSSNFIAKLDDVNISHICCIPEGSESIRNMKIYDKIRNAHINVNGLEFNSDIVLIMKRIKMGISTAVFMFIKKPDDEPGLEAEAEIKLNKKIYEITSDEFKQLFNK